MKKLVITTAAMALLGAPAAFAQTAEIPLTASVASACGLGNHKSGSTAAAGWEQGLQTVDLGIVNGGMPADVTLTTLSFGNIWCNGGATMELSIQPMRTVNTTTDTGSFTNVLDVSIVTDMSTYLEGHLIWDTTYETVGGADFTTGAKPVNYAFETGFQRFGGVDSVTIKRPADNKKLVAGTYNGVIRVEVSPNS